MEAAPVSNHTFLLPIPGWAVKKLPLFTYGKHCSSIDAPSARKTTYVVPRFPGARPYPFLNNPRGYNLTRPRPPPVNKGLTPVCRTQGVARPLQRQGVLLFRRPRRHKTQGWPVRTWARRYSSTHSARSAFLSKTPLGIYCKPEPSPCVYKRGGPGALRREKKGEDKTSVFLTSAINISSNTSLSSSLETWDRLPLSQLVTPTQALRCKEIQNSPPPLDVGPSLSKPG
jgi:hypothetical protein